MQAFTGQTISWTQTGTVVELALHHPPCNEIGAATLEELERFVGEMGAASATPQAAALIIHSALPSGFSAGAALKELYEKMLPVPPAERITGVRDFLTRIHRVFNTLDALPIPVIAAVHGVVFGGGFELTLVADLIVADKTARFCFPELRLGLIPGFGGIPRLKRDLGNGLVRDILFTGRSINAQKAANAGLVSQLVSEGQALRAARGLTAQLVKFDPATAAAAKRFIKPIPHEELRQEIDLFCDLFNRPVVEAALAKFFHSADVRPYLV
jgi:enoyl-CoA hydratase/carnithine racemase